MTVISNKPPPVWRRPFRRIAKARLSPPQILGVTYDEIAPSRPTCLLISIDPPTVASVISHLVPIRAGIHQVPDIQPLAIQHVIPVEFHIPGVLDVTGLLFGSLHVFGTIYVKNRPERAKAEKDPRPVVPWRQQTDNQRRAGPTNDIFELLLAVLMPPLVTRFGTQLLFPSALYPFQNFGVKWLTEDPARLLADEMGLGKTVQSVVALRLLIRQGKALKALVVCPKSVVTVWRKHFEDWAPELRTHVVQGAADTRKNSWRSLQGKVNVFITNFETFRQDLEPQQLPLDVIIVDEASRIKNPETQTARVLHDVRSERRWALTGTPLENSVADTVGIFRFVKPGLFKRREEPSPAVLRERIEPYILRRRKIDVLKDLPLKVPDTKYVTMEEAQRIAYGRAEQQGIIELREGDQIAVQDVLALITKLKQICNFDPRTDESAKLEFLSDYIGEAIAQADKVIVVSQYVKTLEWLLPRLKTYNPLLFSGELTITQRDRLIKEFQDGPSSQVLLMSLRAGAYGITLTRANHVVHYDSWWNPAVLAQAEDRAHRHGQEKTVFVTKLITEDTIEERIEKLLERKGKLFDEVVEGLSDVNLEKVLSEEELFGLFGLTPPVRGKASGSASPEPSRSPVFTPTTPFSNVIQLRDLLRRCSRYLWWADPHFGWRALEDILFAIDITHVREIRILSRALVVDDKARREFKRFADEMNSRGVNVAWRVTEASASHDRYIVTEHHTWNVPPVNAIYEGKYGEALETQTVPPFDEWWAAAQPI